MKKINILLFVVFLSIRGFGFNGDGTETMPFLLTNAPDLVQLANDVNNVESPNKYEGKYFKLTQNIDLSSVEEWTPIGIDILRPFQGVIDGDGFKISNISITGDGVNKGLFGFIKQAQLKNFGVEGNIMGATNLAGIAAIAIKSTVTNCYNNANVIATDDNAGGIVGIAYETEIKNCYNTGTISAKSTIGGIVGIYYNPEEIYNVHANNNGIASIKQGYEKLPYHFIPANIGSAAIARLYDYFLKDNLYVQELEIEAGSLTNFHQQVCYKATNLKKVTIPSGKNVGLGTNSLYGCTELRGTFIIPDNVNAIGAGVMTDCSNIEELHISINLANIPRSFLSMRALKRIYMPRTTMVNMTHIDAFGGLPATAIFYVPSDLVDVYKNDTNWSKFASQFQAIP